MLRTIAYVVVVSAVMALCVYASDMFMPPDWPPLLRVAALTCAATIGFGLAQTLIPRRGPTGLP